MSEKHWSELGFFRDPVFESTRGTFNWESPGMTDFEEGYQDFIPGKRVEVFIKLQSGTSGWHKATVLQGFLETERAIEVVTDEPWHDNMEYHQGCGFHIFVYMLTRREVISFIRSIDEPDKDITHLLPFDSSNSLLA